MFLNFCLFKKYCSDFQKIVWNLKFCPQFSIHVRKFKNVQNFKILSCFQFFSLKKLFVFSKVVHVFQKKNWNFLKSDRTLKTIHVFKKKCVFQKSVLNSKNYSHISKKLFFLS